MHAFRVVHKSASKTAATTLPAIRRAYPVGILAAETRKGGQPCARRWAASLDHLSTFPPQRERLHGHQRRNFQQQPPQPFVQVKCFHGRAEDNPMASVEPAEHPDNLVSSGQPCSPNQSSALPTKDTCDRPVCMERANSNAGTTAHAGFPQTADPLDSPSSEALRETPRTFGRRRRSIRVPYNAAEVSSGGSLPPDREEGGVKQVQTSNVIVGRRRGRAARSCLKAAAAWLEAVLPQVSSADASRYSAVAAVAMLARGGRVGRSAFPSCAASAPDAAQKEAGSWQRPCEGFQGGKTAPLQIQRPEASDGVAEANHAPATAVTADPAAEARDALQCAAAPPSIGRRQRNRSSVGHLGPPGTPDVASGGAMDFQFPILFNKAIKRLLKPLFRRTGQPRRQACSRAASASTPAPAAAPTAGAGAVAVGGARNVQRPRLPPRVLLRSWRPLSKAQSILGPRQIMHARQQQMQTGQRQLLQEGSVVSEQQRGAGTTQQFQQPVPQPQQQQQQQQHEEREAGPAADLATTQEQENAVGRRALDEGALPTDHAAGQPAAAVISGAAEGFESKGGRQGEDAPKDTMPNRADAAAPDVVHEQRGEVQQLQQQAKEVPQKETAARPSPAEPTMPLKKAVGRGSTRGGPARRPLPICFVRQRISTLYRQLCSLLAPHCTTISEWTYRNGNVVVTAGSLLSLTATLMADMRLLRTFNLLAGFCYFSYNWSRRPRLTDAALWNVVFLVLNTVMLWRVHTEHREVSFSSDELDIFQRYFLPAGMSPRQFRRLLRQGSWRTFPQGYVLQQEDSSCETLCFVARGAVEISQGGEVVDTYRGGETGAVLGVEPFLSYVADLRRLSAKRVKHTTASSPETLASHADESPEGLQRHQQTVPAFAVGKEHQQATSTDQKQQRQQQQQQPSRTKEGGERTYNAHLMENAERGAATNSKAVTNAGQDADASKQQHQIPREKPSQTSPTPSLECPRQGVSTRALLSADAGSDGTSNGGQESVSGTSLVAAAAEAAATAAAAVRTAAATALLTETPQTTEAHLPARASAKASTATALVQGGVSSAAEGARHVAEAAAAAASAAVAAAADAASLTEASQCRRAGMERGIQRQQPLRERYSSFKGEPDDADGPREEETVTAPSTATCITETTVFCLDLKELAAFVLREPGNLGFPVVQGLTTLLVNRSRAQAARLAILSYDAFLAGVFADGVVQTGERKMLEEFRRKRAISQAQHEQALARLGWTPEEFERGSQASTGVLSRMAFGLGSFLRGSPEPHGTTDGSLQQLHQGNTSGRAHKDGDAFHSVLPPLLEDWELVEDERAVPPQPAPGDRLSTTGSTNTAETHSSKDCFGDAVSYAFEAEAASFH